METDNTNTLDDIQQNTKVSQTKANLALNSETICLYWKTGNMTLEQQKENSWSRSVLNFQINKDRKIANLSPNLSDEYSELALEIVKDSYKFKFLNLSEEIKELDTEKELVKNLKNFLVESGQELTFISKQCNLKINRQNSFMDLPLYQLKPRCFIAVGSKNTKFKPINILIN